MRRRWAAVIGSPVRHSLSPRVFRSLREKMNRRLEYVAVTVAPRGLREALAGAKSRPWIGWNVTLPHKIEIVALLDGLEVSAKEIGAVNVIRFLDGRSIGYNTDAEGFLEPLRRMDFSLLGRRAVVLGAGGAARAACAALRRCGAGRIGVLGRDASKLAALERDFGVRSGILETQAARDALAGADIVVNATPLGMDGRSSPLADSIPWKRETLAYDLVYRPLETPFLRRARLAGARALGGLPMLVAQAAASWRIWFEEDVPRAAADEVEEELRRFLA